MKIVDVILFDLDGVLVDACEWHYQALNEALKINCGHEINRKDHKTTFNGLPTKTKLNILNEMNIVDPALNDKIWQDKQNLTFKIIEEHAKIDLEKCEMLSKLENQGIKLGCVTNSIRKSAVLMLEKTGQLKYFDLLICNEDVSDPKPNPEGYIKAIQEFSVSKDKVMIVEDSDKGLKAARASEAKYIYAVRNPSDVTFNQISRLIGRAD